MDRTWPAALKADHDFLFKGCVFNRAMLDAGLEPKTEDARRAHTMAHSIGFVLYRSC